MSSLITSFADVEAKEIQWLWKPYIALEKLTLVHGTKEVDLTDFMLRFTAALSTGGIGGLPCSILYFESEKNAGWIKSKLQEYDADLTRISCIDDIVVNSFISSLSFYQFCEFSLIPYIKELYI